MADSFTLSWAVIADIQEAIAFLVALAAALYLVRVWLMPMVGLLASASSEGGSQGVGCGSGGCGGCGHSAHGAASAPVDPQLIALGPPARLNPPFSANGDGRSTGL